MCLIHMISRQHMFFRLVSREANLRQASKFKTEAMELMTASFGRTLAL